LAALIVDLSANDVVAFKFAKLLGQHFATGVRNEPAELAGLVK
jgi:hypothetical protein